MDLSNSFSVLGISPPPSPPRSHLQQQQPSKDPNPNPQKLKELEEDPSMTVNEMLESPPYPPHPHQQLQQASGDPDLNPNPTHRQSRKSRKRKSLNRLRFNQQQKQFFVDVSVPEEIEAAFQSAKTADEMLEVFLHMASLNVVLELLHVEGEDPEKILSFASRAVNALDKDYEKPSIHVVIALQLMGSANYSLDKFDESLSCLERAFKILASLEEEAEGHNMDCFWNLFHKLHRELARVNMAMGKIEVAFENLRKCLDFSEMMDEPLIFGFDNYALANGYVKVLNYKEALPYCLKALDIHMNQLGHDSEVVLQERTLLTHIYNELHDYEKALEQNELLQKIFKDLGKDFDVLCREIEAGDMNIWMGKYDEALVILKKALQKSDKESQTRAQILIASANALFKQKKFVDAKRCLKNAGGILDNAKMEKTIEVGQEYGKMAMLYEHMKEYEPSISLFKKMIAIQEKYPRVQSNTATVATVRIGRILLKSGQVLEGISYLESGVERMKARLGPKHEGLVMVYKYLGAAYLMARRSEPAAQMFAAMKDIPDAYSSIIKDCQVLSKAYDTMESSEAAVEKQQRLIARFKRRGRGAQDELGEAEGHLGRVLKVAHVASNVFAQRVLHMIFS